MTNNIDRIAEVIRRVDGDHTLGAGALAEALAAAGRRAPNLPEPHTFPNGEREWYTPDGWVNLDTDGTITMVADERDEDDIAAGAEMEPGELAFTRISEARNLALALLAAADYAEGVGSADV